MARSGHRATVPSEMASMKRHGWSWIDTVLTALIVTVLVLQLRLLYVFPQPDSARWWGDETGQMLELKSELQTGVAHIPTALGSTLATTNGFVRGNSWMAAILYGIPVYIFDGLASVVSIGRTVTALLGILLIIGVARLVFQLTRNKSAALLAALVLVSTRAWLFGSHAARLDVAAGLAVVLIASFLATKWKARESLAPLGWHWWFAAGAAYIVLSTLSIHLLTIGAVFLIFALWKFRALRWRNVLAVGAGSATVLALLLAIYGLSGAPASLFTKTVASNQFQSVVRGLPIMRPFSRSVQVANLLERLTGLWAEAPVVLALCVASLSALVARHFIRGHQSRFITDLGLASAIAWIFFESPALYYYMQVLPIFIVALIVSIDTLLAERRKWPALAVGALLAYFAVNDALKVAPLSLALAEQNKSATRDVRRRVDMSSVDEFPTLLAQNPAIAELNRFASLRLMTPHLLSFPTSTAPIEEQLSQIGVHFILLYSLPGDRNYSDEYGKLRRVVATNGLEVSRWTGTLFDVDRDYFEPQPRSDTLTLYRLVR